MIIAPKEEEDFDCYCCPYCHKLEGKCECFEAGNCPQCHEYWGYCGCDYSVDDEIP